MLAAHAGYLEIVQLLIQRDADLDATAKHGLTALMLAVVAGHEAVARALDQAGADLAVRGVGHSGFAGKTAHDLAAARGMHALSRELRPDDSTKST